MCSRWRGWNCDAAPARLRSVRPSMEERVSETLELRVLSGLHREARCPARHDDVLGADPSCDVVLADAGVGARAARLRVGSAGWDLVPDGDAPASGDEPSTPFNQPLPMGPVWITVARRSDPWAPLPEAANDGSAGAGLADAAETVDTAMPEDADARARAAPAEETASSAGPARSASRPAATGGRRRGETWPLALGLATMALAVVVAVLMAWLLPPSPPPAPARLDPRVAAERSLGPINAAIERLGLASRLRVNITPDGVVQVSGWVRNATERDSVAAAMAQIWPMPALRVSSEEDAIGTAADVLGRYDIRYEPRYDGNGRLTVRGIADSAEGRAAALDAVRAQLPGMTVMGNDILLAPAVTDALANALADAGLSGIALAWRDRQLQAGTDGLDETQLAELQTVLAQFNTRHFGIAALAPISGARQYADTVPFGIRSVVSGNTPFIVLENGSKLLVGGTYKRYRLTAIEDKRLVFDGPRPAIVLR